MVRASEALAVRSRERGLAFIAGDLLPDPPCGGQLGMCPLTREQYEDVG